MVMMLEAHVADTPVGKPLPPDTPLFAIPVARIVVCVIFVKAVLIHKVGVLDAAPAELLEIVIVPVALTPVQIPPPVRGIL